MCSALICSSTPAVDAGGELAPAGGGCAAPLASAAAPPAARGVPGRLPLHSPSCWAAPRRTARTSCVCIAATQINGGRQMRQRRRRRQGRARESAEWSIERCGPMDPRREVQAGGRRAAAQAVEASALGETCRPLASASGPHATDTGIIEAPAKAKGCGLAPPPSAAASAAAHGLPPSSGTADRRGPLVSLSCRARVLWRLSGRAQRLWPLGCWAGEAAPGSYSACGPSAATAMPPRT